MNKMRYFRIFFVLLLFATYGCRKTDFDIITISLQQSVPITKAGSFPRDTSCYDVTFSDINNYLINKQANAKHNSKTSKVLDIQPKVGATGITSYVINYEKGCEIISADKRVCPVLAFSESENIDISDIPDAAKEWLQELNDQIDNIRMMTNYPLSEIDLANLRYWNNLAKSGYLDPFDPPEIPSSYPPGHWTLVDSQIDYYNNVVDHLVPVKWGQGSPFNNCCPYLRQDFPGKRTPAGCVAIAGAQLLYYLHSLWGVPEKAPSSGSVTGYVVPSNDYVQNCPTENATIWDQMAMHNDSTAFLIGSIGKGVGMAYGSYYEIRNGELVNIQSGASFESFPNYIADKYGIYSTLDSLYNNSGVSTITNSIDNDLPVYVCAINSEQGHAFLIDAYRQDYRKYTNIFQYVCDDPTINSMLHLPRVTKIIHEPMSKYFKMNWGYEGEGDEIWFAPLQDWSHDDVPNFNRRLFYYNFRLTP